MNREIANSMSAPSADSENHCNLCYQVGAGADGVAAVSETGLAGKDGEPSVCLKPLAASTITANA
jgi:hypothetical protein